MRLGEMLTIIFVFAAVITLLLKTFLLTEMSSAWFWIFVICAIISGGISITSRERRG